MNPKPLQILALRSRLVLALVVVPTLLALSATPAPVQAATPIAVDELLQGFAKMPGLYAEFRQESFFGMLAEPLVDEGTLHFADGRLARRTTAPVPSVVVMDGKGIEYGDGHKRERIDLDGKPAIKQFVEAFTMIFAGDRAGLETIYRIEFAPGPVAADGSRSWTMTLVPKVAPMNQVIARVEISGSELAIAKMRVVEVGGDETVTTFSKVDTKRRYSDGEKTKFFTVG